MPNENPVGLDPLLEILKTHGREEAEVLAKELGRPVAEVKAAIEKYEADGVIRGYQAVLNPELADDGCVRAVIELRIRPEREGGFDRIASRICKFEHVESMFLMSGGYDLLLFVKGKSLQELANFVASRLATLDGVLATATHFMLKSYKECGILLEGGKHDDRLQVSP